MPAELALSKPSEVSTTACRTPLTLVTSATIQSWFCISLPPSSRVAVVAALGVDRGFGLGCRRALEVPVHPSARLLRRLPLDGFRGYLIGGRRGNAARLATPGPAPG